MSGFQVRDPIHGTITVEPWAVPLVDSAVMQRLRRVQQLGTAHLVYPGARHSRFEHSLGAYHLAGRMARALELEDEARRTAMAGALLHDVGHGPFSHAFDEVLRDVGQRHEETTVDLVQWGPLADLLRQGEVDPTAVGQAVLGKGPVAGIVSGSVDADRMDYLLRDAHYTGVRTNVDPERLVGQLTRTADGNIAVKEGGLIAAEALLTTRFLMYPAVYLHHSVRASECMLMEALRLWLADGGQLPAVARDTDDELLWRLRQHGGEAAQLVKAVDERRLYKRAFEGSAQTEIPDHVQRLQHDGKARKEAELEIAESAGVPRHHVLVDVPHSPKLRELALHVVGRDGNPRPLAECSRLVQVLQEARLDHWRYWVFGRRRDVDAISKAASSYFEG